MALVDDLDKLNSLHDEAYAEGYLRALRMAKGIAESGSNHLPSRRENPSDEYWRGRLDVAASLEREIKFHSK